MDHTDLGVEPVHGAWERPKFSEVPRDLPEFTETRYGREAEIGILTVMVQPPRRGHAWVVELRWPGGKFTGYEAETEEQALHALGHFLGAYFRRS